MEQFLQEENEFLSLDIIKSIFNHPWMLICPMVMVISIIVGVLINIKPLYQCDALISFTIPGKEVTGAGGGVIRRDVVLSRVLIGDNMKQIISETFPQITEETDEVQYNKLAKGLQKRIDMRWRAGDLLNISYIDQDPNRTYKVLKATIATIERETNEANRREIEIGLSYLRRQAKFYADKLKSFDKEIEELQRGIIATEQITPEKGQDITGVIINLQQKIVEEIRRNEELEGQTKKDGIYLLGIGSETDPVIAGYSKSLDEKERMLANLISQGYKQAHPYVNKVREEVENLKILKERRYQDLLQLQSEEDKEIARQNIIFELQKSTFELETMKKQLSILKERQETTATDGRDEAISRYDIDEQRAKLRELEQEKKITQNAYDDIIKKTANAEAKLRQEMDEEIGLAIKVVNKPIIPREPMTRNIFPKLLMGMIIAVSTGIGLSLGANAINTSVKSSVELRDLLHLPVIASIDTMCTPEEIRAKNFRRIAGILGLVIFIILSQIVIGKIM